MKVLDQLYLSAYNLRQGPVLLDVPIDLQNIKVVNKKKFLSKKLVDKKN